MKKLIVHTANILFLLFVLDMTVACGRLPSDIGDDETIDLLGDGEGEDMTAEETFSENAIAVRSLEGPNE